ncbi:GNAT family N-acetyltransferase [Nonomuraea insulae]|uniref:GNAT family N-acetyltransferase n=1 Tax=Nonomuraea insulae TaxID=1616787 RepID=A0ABW1D014_9ACTN
MAISVRAIGPDDLSLVSRVLTESWGGTTLMVLGRGELVNAAALPGFVAELDGEAAGVVTYAESEGSVEIATLDAVLPGKGVGRALLDAVRAVAVERAADRLWLVTTNDNTTPCASTSATASISSPCAGTPWIGCGPASPASRPSPTGSRSGMSSS